MLFSILLFRVIMFFLFVCVSFFFFFFLFFFVFGTIENVKNKRAQELTMSHSLD